MRKTSGCLSLLSASVLLLGLPPSALAREAADPAAPLGVAPDTVNPALFSGLKWREIGPWRGGRVTAVTGVRGNDRLYYMGATGGGVW